MSRVAVITDSNSGITQAQAKDLGIQVIPMPFMFGDSDETYYEDINLTREEFFQRLAEGQTVHTSQPSPVDVIKAWDKALETYDQVVYIPMSSGLSGSCQSAMMISSEYDGKVQVVNNQRISGNQKDSVFDAMALADKGWDAEKIRAKLEEVKYQNMVYIMVDTLTYLKRGGRVTPAAAAIGTLLKIKPVLQLRCERLDAFSKARTTQQGKNTMLNAMRKDIETEFGGVGNVHLQAVQAQCPEQFAVWYDEVKAAFPEIQVGEDSLSLSVCCHIGPGALALSCSQKIAEVEREEW